MKRKTDDLDHFVPSEAQRQLAIDYVSAGYVPGQTEIGGLLVRTSQSNERNRVFVPGPFEPGSRYMAITTSDARDFKIHGWITGDDILRDGEESEFGGQQGYWIEQKRFQRLTPKDRGDSRGGRTPSLASVRETRKEEYIMESAAAMTFAKFKQCPWPPPDFERVGLGDVEIVGFTIRASRFTEGDEVFLSEPLQLNRRYAAVVCADRGCRICGWITGRDALRLGNPSKNARRGVWVKYADLREFDD